MEGEIELIARQLASAVELATANSVPQQQRLEAYNVCEEFKEKSPLCVQCGLYLVRHSEFSQIVRHFGLQCMEHCIKYRWRNLSQPEKHFIKENAMELLESEASQLETHIKDGMTRVMVELMKHEWPQQWPTLLTDMSLACTKGCSQTVLVMLSFLRLAEDVVILKTLESTQRRKTLYQELSTNMAHFFKFFLQLLEEHYKAYNLSLEQDMSAAAAHAKVVQIVLKTLNGFVEWAAMKHILADDGKMLQMLCFLLRIEAFQTPAAECLLLIVSRKCKAEESRSLLILISTEALACMFHATGVASEKIIENENHYGFLKKLTELLAAMGMQLSSHWGKEEWASTPLNFSMFLEATVKFAQHPSHTIAFHSNSVWNAYIKHEIISKDSLFISYLPKWIEATASKILKVVFPSNKIEISANDAVLYSLIDYCSEEEFNIFFDKCRASILNTFKQAALVAPQVIFTYVQGWLTQRVHKTMTIPEPMCTVQSASYIEWEALSLVLDGVLSKIVMCSERPPASAGLQLLEFCLALDSKDPLILSLLLTCISALLVFLNMVPAESATNYLPGVLDKIFNALVFDMPVESRSSDSIKNIHHHAASLIVKMAQKYSPLLLPFFDRIKELVTDLEKKAVATSILEFTSLKEALLLINNQFCDYERQREFVGEVLRPVGEHWRVMTSEVFTSTEVFMAFVGLDKPPVEPSKNDTNFHNRFQIMYTVDVLSAVVRHCTWPDDPERALTGGFVIGRTDSGDPIYRNPATPHLLPLLPGILNLIKMFNSLWTPEAQGRVYPGYEGAHAMLEEDRNNLLGITSRSDIRDHYRPQPSRTALHRMQCFLSKTNECCYQILSHAFPSLSHDLYHMPHLAQYLIDTVMHNLENIPDYRLRILLRRFFKPFFASCPSDCYDTVLVPVLARFTPFMFLRLDTKWQHIVELQDSGSANKKCTDVEEVLEDMLIRELTRKYLKVLKLALIKDSVKSSNSDSTAMEQDCEDQRPVHSSTEVISELGLRLLQCDTTCQAVTLCLLSALSYNDSESSATAACLVGPVLSQLVVGGMMNAELASNSITSVLQGLQLHAQHEYNEFSLVMVGTQLYELLRPLYPQVLEVMKQIPNVNLSDLENFESIIEVQTKNKVKRDLFRKITLPLHGLSIGQMFKRKAAMEETPRT